MKKRVKALWNMYVASFFVGFTFVTPIWILFFQLRGLSLAEIGFTATGTYLVNFLLEYPAGIYADRYGRKKACIVGTTLMMLSFIVEATAHSLTQFVIGAALVGAGWAFISGAREALVYDTLKQHKLQRFNSIVLGRMDSLSSLGGMLSAFSGSVLYAMHSTIPYWLSAIAYCVAVAALVPMKEHKFAQKLRPHKQFLQGLSLVFKSPTIRSLLLLYIPVFFFEEAWYNASQPILLGLGLPLVFLGAYQGMKTGLFGIGGWVLPKLVKTYKHRTLLLGVVILEALLWVLLGSNSLVFVIASSYVLIIIH